MAGRPRNDDVTTVDLIRHIPTVKEGIGGIVVQPEILLEKLRK